MIKKKLLITAALALTFLSATVYSDIVFEVAFTAQAQIDLDASEQALFTDALEFWDTIILGHRDDVSRTWSLTVDTFEQEASGGGVLLGSAGPTDLFYSNPVADSGLSAPQLNKFLLSGGGIANFNVHPDAGALQAATIRHEIGHTLGIGILWEDNEVYNDGVAGNHNRTLAGGVAGQYMGAAALAAYQAEFDPTALYIPVELDGGPGTANGHWNEVLDNYALENVPGFDLDPGDGSAAPNSVNGSLDDELMTGVLSGSAYISNTTIASLYDIGFEVIPEPAVLGFVILTGLGALIVKRFVQ